MDDELEEKLSDYFDEFEKSQLKDLVSISDKKGDITWEDVEKDDDIDISTKIWGKSIEIGVLEETSKRSYKLNNKSQINKYINDNWIDTDKEGADDEIDMDELPNVDYSKTKWRSIDKAAMGVAMICMIGFQFGPIRSVIYGIVDIFLGPLNGIFPIFAVIFILSIITSAWTVGLREYVIDVDVSNIQERVNKLQGNDEKSLLSGQGDVDDDKREELSKLQIEMMKGKFRPFGWIMIFTIPAVIWVYTTTTIIGGQGTLVFPLIGELVWADNVVGPLRTWIFWYIICGLPMNSLIEKLLGK
jgi:uncharacterized membrane protein (DUF106 family)